MAALTLLQRDLLARINPAIVESYLARLNAAGLLTAQPTAAGDGILLLESRDRLPAGLGGGTRALVATSGEALRSPGVDTRDVLALGPGEEAFSALIAFAEDELGPDVYQSGASCRIGSYLPRSIGTVNICGCARIHPKSAGSEMKPHSGRAVFTTLYSSDGCSTLPLMPNWQRTLC